MKTLLAVCAIALVSGTFSMADEWNHKTVVTFSQPVSIPAVHKPGMGVLPAGKYVFKLLDSQSDRHIVQIFNEDQSEIYATILAIPNMRLTPTDKVVITFRETPAGQPLALRALFYPGAMWGEEFVYPKAKAVQIAKAVETPVLAAPIATEEAAPELPEIIAELEKAPVVGIEPSGEEVETTEIVTVPAETAAPAVLPKTASQLPLLGLTGLFLITAATMLGVAATRTR